MADPNPQALSALLSIARERTKAGRVRIFDNITDFFLTAENRLSERERAIMLDILTALIHEVENRVRSDLVQRLSELDEVPRDLIVAISNMEVDVARPLLIDSDLLRDPDLIEIIRLRSQEHMMAIALRSELSEDVSEALVTFGDDNVVEQLLRNRDAALSRRALAYLVAESQRVDSFQQPLLKRPDLPKALAQRMYWWVSAALRKFIVDNYGLGEDFIDDYIVDSTTSVMAEILPASIDEEAAKLIERLDTLEQLNDRFLLKALRAGQVNIFLAGVARLARLEISKVRRVVFDPSGEPLAMLSKALDFDRQAFATLFLLARRTQERTLPPDRMKTVLDFFDTLDRAQAKTALRYWRTDDNYLMAVDQLHYGRVARV